MSETVVITQEGAQLICTGHHQQIVMVEWPTREIHIPLAISLMIELEFVLLMTTEHTL
jgi:hypothetical protein